MWTVCLRLLPDSVATVPESNTQITRLPSHPTSVLIQFYFVSLFNRHVLDFTGIIVACTFCRWCLNKNKPLGPDDHRYLSLQTVLSSILTRSFDFLLFLFLTGIFASFAKHLNPCSLQRCVKFRLLLFKAPFLDFTWRNLVRRAQASMCYFYTCSRDALRTVQNECSYEWLSNCYSIFTTIGKVRFTLLWLNWSGDGRCYQQAGSRDVDCRIKEVWK